MWQAYPEMSRIDAHVTSQHADDEIMKITIKDKVQNTNNREEC